MAVNQFRRSRQRMLLSIEGFTFGEALNWFLAIRIARVAYMVFRFFRATYR